MQCIETKYDENEINKQIKKTELRRRPIQFAFLQDFSGFHTISKTINQTLVIVARFSSSFSDSFFELHGPKDFSIAQTIQQFYDFDHVRHTCLILTQGSIIQ